MARDWISYLHPGAWICVVCEASNLGLCAGTSFSGGKCEGEIVSDGWLPSRGQDSYQFRDAGVQAPSRMVQSASSRRGSVCVRCYQNDSIASLLRWSRVHGGSTTSSRLVDCRTKQWHSGSCGFRKMYRAGSCSRNWLMLPDKSPGEQEWWQKCWK
ncbi:hypothetical protein BKA80DRAFT_260027, partial [Phyllosticta citrichinensis]